MFDKQTLVESDPVNPLTIFIKTTETFEIQALTTQDQIEWKKNLDLILNDLKKQETLVDLYCDDLKDIRQIITKMDDKLSEYNNLFIQKKDLQELMDSVNKLATASYPSARNLDDNFDRPAKSILLSINDKLIHLAKNQHSEFLLIQNRLDKLEKNSEEIKILFNKYFQIYIINAF